MLELKKLKLNFKFTHLIATLANVCVCCDDMLPPWYLDLVYLLSLDFSYLNAHPRLFNYDKQHFKLITCHIN